MSLNLKTDPRSMRSRQWMRTALLELIQEKDFANISIAEITERAGLARPTFYLHFKNKEDLLLNLLDEVFEQFFVEIDPYLGGDMIGEVVGVRLFEQVQRQANLLQLILRIGADAYLVQRFQTYILRVFQHFLDKNRHRQIQPRLLAFTADYLAGASWGLIHGWLGDGMQYSPQVMGHIYFELIQPGLSAVLVRGALDDSFLL